LTVEIETEDKPIEVRAYMNVSEQKSGEFINTTQAFKSADSREIVLKRAYQELEAFKQKYKNLKELAKVFEAIDELKTPA
jgi:bifunctional DNA-binding transcriptional regulator/antitoxin component of YhaV-PrlF toxin-antitoxin module